MNKLRKYFVLKLLVLSTGGIFLLACNQSLREYSKQKDNTNPTSITQSETKKNKLIISDYQHIKELKFIKDYMIILRNNSKYKNHPIPSTRVIEKETYRKIQRGEITAKKPFKHYSLSYNIDINALFITAYAADTEQEIYIGEKRFSDYYVDGLRIGTNDKIEWSLYNPDLEIFVSSNLDFSKEKRYQASIEGDIFYFDGGTRKIQKRMEDIIAEYKIVVHKINQILK